MTPDPPPLPSAEKMATVGFEMRLDRFDPRLFGGQHGGVGLGGAGGRRGDQQHEGGDAGEHISDCGIRIADWKSESAIRTP